MSKYYQNLLTNKLNNPYTVLLTTIIFGFIYGIFFIPMWSEVAEFGQIISGSILYKPNNPWFYEVNRSVTLLTFIPALLIKWNFSTWTISLLSSGAICSVCFSAVGLTSYIFCRNWYLASLIPFIFINYAFGSNHYYAVNYPLYFFSFGQIGLFLSILCFTTLSLRLYSIAGFIIGIIPALHGGWGMLVWIVTTFFFILSKKNEFAITKKFIIYFIFGLIIFLFSYALQREIIHPQNPIADPNFNLAIHLQNENLLRLIWAQRDENGYPVSHNVIIHESPTPVYEYLRFFSSEISILLLILILFYNKKYLNSHAINYLKIILIITAFVSTLRMFEEIFPHFLILQNIWEPLPYYLQRIIVGRWLNINSVSYPVIAISSLIYFSIKYSNKISFIGVLFLIYTGLNQDWNISLFNLEINKFGIIFIIFFIYCSVSSQFNWSKFNYSSKIILITFILSGIYPFTRSFHNMIINKPYLGNDRYDSLAKKASEKDGLLILGPSVKGVFNFNPQLRTNRPIAVPTFLFNLGNNIGYKYVKNFNEKIYCLDIYSYQSPFYFSESIKKCFEKKSADEWIAIQIEFGATSIITTEDWILNLPMELRSEGYKLYSISK
jgi:hypothetical protein